MKYLIVGLGNIGPEYHDTRHNVGFMVLDRLAEQLKVSPEPNRYASTASGRVRGRQLHLVWPSTYMNLSGKAVRFYLDKHKLTPSQMLVITDDLALPFGKLRLRPRGSDGGHNGLKHIQEILGTNEYPRLRVGIGSDFAKGQQVDYVLDPFTAEEQEALPPILDRCVEGVISFATVGIERTMTSLNRG
ncbi:MAG: aminoacyl-tRNA hydrolase [Bacteroidetes bacterium]|nr:MAG: aminoacyl-tRNA hydrolase [Bacteroidota bacterium]